MNKPFKLSILMTGLVFLVTLIFGMYIGYEWCSIHNNVPGMREQLAQETTLRAEVNMNARSSAVKVEEQIGGIEKGFEQLRAALNELKRNSGKAADVAGDKAEQVGKSIEGLKKDVTGGGAADGQ